MAIEFPFVQMSPIELAFPIVPNYDEVIAALPAEFDERTVFLEAASKWFTRTFNPSEDLPGFSLKVDDIEDAKRQRDYIDVWSRTYQPKHQVKIDVIAWLLSLAFEKTDAV
jgi:hypothetical protein